MAVHRTGRRGFGPIEPDPTLKDVLDAIGEIKDDMLLLLNELKTISQLLRDLPIDLERKGDF
jgi:hypothetical protein